MFDDAAVLLRHTRQEARHIDQRQDRNFKRIAKPNKTRRLTRGFDIEHTGQHHRLVCDHTDRAAFDTNETGNDILSKFFLNFVEITLVGELEDQLFHIIGRVCILWHQCIERWLNAVRLIKEGAHGRFFTVVGGQEIDQAADLGQRFDIVLEGGIGDGGFLGVRGGTAQLFCGDLLVCDSFDHIRAGHKHVRAVFDHKDKVGHGGGINGTTGTGPHDHADLWHDARGLDVALEDIAIARKAVDAFLNTRAAGIVDANDGRAILDRHVHDLANLLGVSGRNGTAQNGEVLREYIDEATVDRTPTCDNTVACRLLLLHTKVGTAVRDKHVELFKRALIQQKVHPLARCEFAAPMLCVDAFLPTTQTRIRAAIVKLLQDIFHGQVPLPNFIAQCSEMAGRHKGQFSKFANCFQLPWCKLQIS